VKNPVIGQRYQCSDTSSERSFNFSWYSEKGEETSWKVLEEVMLDSTYKMKGVGGGVWKYIREGA